MSAIDTHERGPLATPVVDISLRVDGIDPVALHPEDTELLQRVSADPFFASTLQLVTADPEAAAKQLGQLEPFQRVDYLRAIEKVIDDEAVKSRLMSKYGKYSHRQDASVLETSAEAEDPESMGHNSLGFFTRIYCVAAARLLTDGAVIKDRVHAEAAVIADRSQEAIGVLFQKATERAGKFNFGEDWGTVAVATAPDEKSEAAERQKFEKFEKSLKVFHLYGLAPETRSALAETSDEDLREAVIERAERMLETQVKPLAELHGRLRGMPEFRELPVEFMPFWRIYRAIQNYQSTTRGMAQYQIRLTRSGVPPYLHLKVADKIKEFIDQPAEEEV